MKNKTVVITGGTSGIGQIAAEKLATMGARIVLVARDRARGEAALERLRAAGPGADHAIHYGDLSRIAEMKRVAAAIAAAEPRVDVLVNNAGALFNSRQLTEDGLELTFATNHMAYFVLTEGLRASLLAAAPARIVSTASVAHNGARLDFDDLQASRWDGGLRVYGRSKLCNILHTRELARRLAGSGVTANCLHPGFVATRFGDESGGAFAYAVRFSKLFAISPEKGAASIVYLASSPDVATASGGYYSRCKPARMSRAAQDEAAARRLWEESARLAGVSG